MAKNLFKNSITTKKLPRKTVIQISRHHSQKLIMQLDHKSAWHKLFHLIRLIPTGCAILHNFAQIQFKFEAAGTICGQYMGYMEKNCDKCILSTYFFFVFVLGCEIIMRDARQPAKP